ncbi:type I-F CRISPR-associated protein Csy3 [Vibrio sp. CAU 1672]|uniref:type I-F CRISPR-associated protein Csy3 n=1 Tax=Vibrio sp. CAU 1672 TaxID=3032594 RepID=UPI0023DAA743|nr:type I-F CRISPR-associated protein Csy3 [Vibrio sp. CAU 1672]MDF2152876.1 type I-F CRISPR-associated protein Csy3 [Vibrio sp. CAU 1672]
MELCRQLNYVRSISPGKAYFYYLAPNGDMCPLAIDKTRLRAPKGGYAEAYQGSSFAKRNVAPQDLAYANPQFIEECYVPPMTNEIVCEFSLRIKANSLHPDVCSDDGVREQLTLLATTYKKLNGYQELAYRYAKNILLGSWLWRNRECRGVAIKVMTSDGETIEINDATKLSWYGHWDELSTQSLEKLTSYLSRALSDSSQYFYMDVKAVLSVGRGDEVYPSQEFIDDKQEGFPTKQLAKVPLNDEQETAAFHAQKIGAALQSIDDWWHENADKPLRVNEYGADRQYVIARRHTLLGNDFYQLIRGTEKWIKEMKEFKSIPNDVHFILSVLIKGGLFNSSKTKSR